MNRPDNIRPDWHRLVTTWIKRGGTGLTIPFLVGARRLITGDDVQPAQAAIESLLHEIVEAPIAGSVGYARWCDEVGAVILEIRATDAARLPVHDRVEFAAAEGCVSLITTGRLAAFLEVDAQPDRIFEALVLHALPAVEKHCYSRTWKGGAPEFGPFDAKDIDFIREATGLA